jgi:hypothetical protein
MKPEYLEKLVAWYEEEVDAFRAKGATEEIVREPAFLELVVDVVMAKHSEEIRAIPGFVYTILNAGILGQFKPA